MFGERRVFDIQFHQVDEMIRRIKQLILAHPSRLQGIASQSIQQGYSLCFDLRPNVIRQRITIGTDLDLSYQNCPFSFNENQLAHILHQILVSSYRPLPQPQQLWTLFYSKYLEQLLTEKQYIRQEQSPLKIKKVVQVFINEFKVVDLISILSPMPRRLLSWFLTVLNRERQVNGTQIYFVRRRNNGWLINHFRQNQLSAQDLLASRPVVLTLEEFEAQMNNIYNQNPVNQQKVALATTSQHIDCSWSVILMQTERSNIFNQIRQRVIEEQNWWPLFFINGEQETDLLIYNTDELRILHQIKNNMGQHFLSLFYRLYHNINKLDNTIKLFLNSSNSSDFNQRKRLMLLMSLERQQLHNILKKSENSFIAEMHKQTIMKTFLLVFRRQYSTEHYISVRDNQTHYFSSLKNQQSSINYYLQGQKITYEKYIFRGYSGGLLQYLRENMLREHFLVWSIRYNNTLAVYYQDYRQFLIFKDADRQGRPTEGISLFEQLFIQQLEERRIQEEQGSVTFGDFTQVMQNIGRYLQLMERQSKQVNLHLNVLYRNSQNLAFTAIVERLRGQIARIPHLTIRVLLPEKVYFRKKEENQTNTAGINYQVNIIQSKSRKFLINKTLLTNKVNEQDQNPFTPPSRNPQNRMNEGSRHYPSISSYWHEQLYPQNGKSFKQSGILRGSRTVMIQKDIDWFQMYSFILEKWRNKDLFADVDLNVIKENPLLNSLKIIQSHNKSFLDGIYTLVFGQAEQDKQMCFLDFNYYYFFMCRYTAKSTKKLPTQDFSAFSQKQHKVTYNLPQLYKHFSQKVNKTSSLTQLWTQFLTFILNQCWKQLLFINPICKTLSGIFQSLIYNNYSSLILVLMINNSPQSRQHENMQEIVLEYSYHFSKDYQKQEKRQNLQIKSEVSFEDYQQISKSNQSFCLLSQKNDKQKEQETKFKRMLITFHFIYDKIEKKYLFEDYQKECIVGLKGLFKNKWNMTLLDSVKRRQLYPGATKSMTSSLTII